VVRLDQIFRQGERSLIVLNAHRVNHGEMPLLEGGDDLRDFYFVEREEVERAADTVVELVTSRIPSRFGLDPVDEVQLLTPMHRGELGVTALNERLRAVLNPAGPELEIGARRYRLGDKVMQTRNNYELEVFNGDIGRVVGVDVEEARLTVRFDEREVALAREDLDDLAPAYACTIHKSQGSEYPAVVVVLHHQHHIMLQRNLLYTAITRGRRLVVLVGSRRALRRAVANATVRRRHTLLAERLTPTSPRPQPSGPADRGPGKSC
jgi:exodeoxyribonuclease V alpha subunit